MELVSVATSAAGSAVWWAIQRVTRRIKAQKLSELTEESVKTALASYYERVAARLGPVLLPSAKSAQKTLNELYTQQFARLQSTSCGASPPGRNAEPVTSLVEAHRNLLLLGRPGSGKSAFLRSLALGINQLTVTGGPCVLIDARSFGTARKSLRHYLTDNLRLLHGLPNPLDILDELFAAGRIHILWDALDEVSSRDDLRHVLDSIEDLTHDAPSSHQVVTCRAGAYAGWLPGFVTAYLQPFRFDDILHFVDQWFRGDEDRAVILKGNLTNLPAAQNLATSPLFLSLLCVAAEDNLYPMTSRVELFKTALNAALTRWDASRAIERHDPYRNIQPGDRHAILCAVAQSSVNRASSIWPEAEMAQVVATSYDNIPTATTGVDGLAIMEAIASQHGVIERQGTEWSFSHWALEEYLAAVNYSHDPKKVLGLVGSALNTPRLRGVAINSLCLLPDASELTGALAQLVSERVHETGIRELGSQIRKEFRKRQQMTPVMTRQLCFEVVMFQVQHVALFVDELTAQLAGTAQPTNFAAQINDIIQTTLTDGPDYTGKEKSHRVLYSRDRYRELLEAAMEELQVYTKVSGLSAESLQLFDLSSRPPERWPAPFSHWTHFRKYGEMALSALQAVGFLVEASVAGARMTPAIRASTLTTVLTKAERALQVPDLPSGCRLGTRG